MISITIASAANTEAPALAVLQAKGYTVQSVNTPAGTLQATSGNILLFADNMLSLLGLASIIEVRGNNWQPSDAEVEALLSLEQDL